jgi:hypothetical protein
MADNGLLFIPDISGFTKFVNENEIDHSRIIIEELLENIINSNKIGLQISEVEGDAVLFYRFGESPSFEEISTQVEQTFCNFQRQIKNYEELRMCECAACKSAINLSLKIITHYGEFSSYKVKEFSKLIGKDVIVAHQLLKNDIDLHEYWLTTNNVFPAKENIKPIPEWLTWQHGNKQTETGDIHFNYSLLTSLKENIEPESPPDFSLSKNEIKVLSKTKIIDAPIIKVLSVMGDLSLRKKWQAGVKEVDQVSHPIYHLGISFRTVTDNGSTTFHSSSFSKTDDSFSLTETDKNKTQSINVTLQTLSENKTSVTFDIYLVKKPFIQILFNLFMKKKTENSLKQSLDNLELLLIN